MKWLFNLFIFSILTLIFAKFSFSQEIYDNSFIKKIGGSLGLEIYTSKDKASLIGLNFKGIYSIKRRMTLSFFYKKGNDISGFGGVERMPERENLVNYLNEVGLLFGYKISKTQTGPFLRSGLSYLSGKKNNKNIIKTLGIPLEGGVNFQVTNFLSFCINITGNLNEILSYHGLGLSINIGVN